jgi:hypothetical protein
MSLVAPSIGIDLRFAPLPTPSLAALSARLRRTPLANTLGETAEHQRIIALNQPTRQRGRPGNACRTPCAASVLTSRVAGSRRGLLLLVRLRRLRPKRWAADADGAVRPRPRDPRSPTRSARQPSTWERATLRRARIDMHALAAIVPLVDDAGAFGKTASRVPEAPLPSGRRRRVGGAGLAEQPPRPYPYGHVLGLRVVDTAVLELNHRIDALAAQTLKVVAFASANRPLHELVVDAPLVERPLHPPASVWLNLEPHVAAAMKLDGHAVPSDTSSRAIDSVSLRPRLSLVLLTRTGDDTPYAGFRGILGTGPECESATAAKCCLSTGAAARRPSRAAVYQCVLEACGGCSPALAGIIGGRRPWIVSMISPIPAQGRAQGRREVDGQPSRRVSFRSFSGQAPASAAEERGGRPEAPRRRLIASRPKRDCGAPPRGAHSRVAGRSTGRAVSDGPVSGTHVGVARVACTARRVFGRRGTRSARSRSRDGGHGVRSRARAHGR